MARMAAVWDRTTEFLVDNLPGVLPLALLTIFLPNSVQQNLALAATAAAPGLKLGLSLLTILLTMLTLWGKLAITAMALGRVSGTNSPASTAARRLLPAIGILALFGLIILALLIPPLLVLVAYSFDFTTLSAPARATMPEAAKVPFAIAMLIMVPIIVWLLARLYLVLVPTIVAERRGARAISRSFALSRGWFWQILGVLLLYAIVAGVAELAARTVFGSIFELVVGGTGPLSLAKILTSIVSGAVSCAFTVLATAFCAKLYLATSGQDDLTLT